MNLKTMDKETRLRIKEKKQSLVDFFYVYFDEKISKQVDRHPELAIPMIREAIQDGVPQGRSRLMAYAAALSTAVELQSLVSESKKN